MTEDRVRDGIGAVAVEAGVELCDQYGHGGGGTPAVVLQRHRGGVVDVHGRAVRA
ncbi:hypothetical protein [Kitasatospora sp. HPMI-4]|uniref:hypothetical protein n=1 Tax=Kitasatospora sp. HPMI-4 TaxID=3448443 RepID=UPI003F1A7239